MLRFLFNYWYILGTLNQHRFHCSITAHTYDNILLTLSYPDVTSRLSRVSPKYNLGNLDLIISTIFRRHKIFAQYTLDTRNAEGPSDFLYYIRFTLKIEKCALVFTRITESVISIQLSLISVFIKSYPLYPRFIVTE